MSDDRTPEARLVELAREASYAMVTTTAPDGTYVSRPMAHQQVEDDADLWFFTKDSSRLAEHVAADPHVAVTLTDNDSWVSVDGRAQVVTDSAKAHELWNNAIEAWLPSGPDGDDIVMIRVEARSGEFWDSPGGKISTALSFLKVKAGGSPFRGRENETVEL